MLMTTFMMNKYKHFEPVLVCCSFFKIQLGSCYLAVSKL